MNTPKDLFPKFNSGRDVTRWMAAQLSRSGIPADSAIFGEDVFGEDSGNALVVNPNTESETRFPVSYESQSGLLRVGNTLYTNSFIAEGYDKGKPLGEYLNPQQTAMRFLTDAIKTAKQENMPVSDVYTALTDPLPRPGIATDLRTMPSGTLNKYSSTLTQLYPRSWSSRMIGSSALNIASTRGYIPVKGAEMGEEFVPTDDESFNPDALTRATTPTANVQTSIHFGMALGDSPGMSYRATKRELTVEGSKSIAGKIDKFGKRAFRERWEADPLLYPNEGTQQEPRQLMVEAFLQKRELGEGRAIIGQLRNATIRTTPQKSYLPIDSHLDLSQLKLEEGFTGQHAYVGREGATLATIGENKIRLPSTNFAASNIGEIRLGIGMGRRVINQLTSLLGSERRDQIEANFMYAKAYDDTARQEILDLVEGKTGIKTSFGTGANDGMSLVFEKGRVAEIFSSKSLQEKDLPVYQQGATEFLEKNNIDIATAYQNVKYKPEKIALIAEGLKSITQKNEKGEWMYSGKKWDSIRDAALKVREEASEWAANGTSGMELLDRMVSRYDELGPKLTDPDTGESFTPFPIIQKGFSVEYPGKGRVGLDILNWMGRENPELQKEVIQQGVKNNAYLRYQLMMEQPKAKEVGVPEGGVVTDKNLTTDNRLKAIGDYLSDKVNPGQMFSVNGVTVVHPEDVIRNGTTGMKTAYSRLFDPYNDAWKNPNDGRISDVELQGFDPYPINQQMTDRAMEVVKQTGMHISGNYGANADARKEMESVKPNGLYYAQMQGNPDLGETEARYGRVELEKMARDFGVSESDIIGMGPIPTALQRYPASMGPLYANATYDKSVKTGLQISMSNSIRTQGDWDSDSVEAMPLIKKDENGNLVRMAGADEAVNSQGQNNIAALQVLATIGGEDNFNKKLAEIQAAKGAAPTPDEMIQGYEGPNGRIDSLKAGKQNVVGGAIEDSILPAGKTALTALTNPSRATHVVSNKDMIDTAQVGIESKSEMSGFLLLRGLQKAVGGKALETANQSFPNYQSGFRSMADAASLPASKTSPAALIHQQIANAHLKVLDMESSELPFAIKGFNFEWLSRWANTGRDGASFRYGNVVSQDFTKFLGVKSYDPETIATLFAPPDEMKQKALAQFVRDARAGKGPKRDGVINDILTGGGEAHITIWLEVVLPPSCGRRQRKENLLLPKMAGFCFPIATAPSLSK